MLQNVLGGAGGVDEASSSDALGSNPTPYGKVCVVRLQKVVLFRSL